jgi:hypothetical protein
MKGAEAVTLLNLIVNLLSVLVATVVCDGLVVPTLTLPKLRVSGLACSSSVASFSAKAGLAAAKPIARRRAKLKTKNVKKDDFGRDMINSSRENDSVTNVCVRAHPHNSFPAPNESRPEKIKIGSGH